MARRLMDCFIGLEDPKYTAYLKRLEEHVKQLSNPVEKKYSFGCGTIETEESDLLDNPNGRNKWNGWVKVGRRYSIRVFDKGTLVQEGTFDDKETANKWFVSMRELCKNFEEETHFG